MIRATTLGGRAVVDMDAAEKLGKIDKVILDPDARRVAGFVVSRGSTLISEGTRVTVPASAVYAVGPDAVTVHHDGAAGEDIARLETLPRVGDVVGRKVVSTDGRFLGTVRDVLISDDSGRIVGYALREESTIGKLDELLSGPQKTRDLAYLRADADLRAGRDLIVAPEDAVSRTSDPEEDATMPPQDRPVTCRWAEPTAISTSPRAPGNWTRKAG